MYSYLSLPTVSQFVLFTTTYLKYSALFAVCVKWKPQCDLVAIILYIAAVFCSVDLAERTFVSSGLDFFKSAGISSSSSPFF